MKPSAITKYLFGLILLCTGLTAFSAAKTKVTDDFANEKIVIQAVNEYRAKRGLPALKARPEITREARKHSQDMAQKKMPFGHQQFQTRIKRIYSQIPNCRSGSENVAWFPPGKSAREVVRLWLTSPGHRRNIEGHFNLTGVGIVRDSRGWIEYTQIFIRTA